MALGGLRIQTFSDGTYIPIDGAKVTVTRENPDGSASKTISLDTNSSGQTATIELEAPPLENSTVPEQKNPYYLYTVTIRASGYREVLINGVQLLPDEIALQNFNMTKLEDTNRQERIIDIPPNVQNGDFPPKIPEDDEKYIGPGSGLVVLPEPVVPEFITIFDGKPTSSSGQTYTVKYTEYVKNALSSEIYATWPDETIKANAVAVISFSLNRIFTEWYRSKGKEYQITNSTAYDLAFNYGRNIYDNIDRIVDEIFTTYVKRPGAKQPLLTQFCDGQNVKCPGWMTQWGSKYLGDQGIGYQQIMRNFYGDIVFAQATKVTGTPTSYPGYTLGPGNSGPPVKIVQEFLNRISNNYPLIPKVKVDGIYGADTANQVKVFQSIFNLPQTGKVDYATWYKISAIYVGVTKIAELRATIDGIDEYACIDQSRIFTPPVFGGKEGKPSFRYPI